MADNYNDQDLYGDYTYEDGETPASLSALIATFRNLRVNSAMIENLAVQDQHVQNVSAAKITAGELLVDSNNIAFNASWKKDTQGWELNGAFRDIYAPFDDTLAIKVGHTGLASDMYYGVKLADAYRIKCTPGQKFTGSVYYYVADSSSFDDVVGLELEWYDPSGVRIGISSFTEMPTHSGYYKRMSVTGEAPPNAAKAGMYVWVKKNGTAWFAKPQLQTGSFLTAWTANGTYIGPNGIMTTDIIFSGTLQGATGTFAGDIIAQMLRVRLPDWFDESFGIGIEIDKGFQDSNGVLIKTGTAVLGTTDDGWFASTKDINGNPVPARFAAAILEGQTVIGTEGFTNVGKSTAFSWYGTVNNGSYIDLVHNLGYYPIAMLGGNTGNLQLTCSFINVNVLRVYNYSSGGNAWTGSVHLY